MGILELVAFLEGRFGLHVGDSEIVPANMDSIRSIADYVTGKRAVANAA
jgi:acyl carrier protein